MTVRRERHAFEGQTLAVVGDLKRRGVHYLLAILPDGSRSLIPAALSAPNASNRRRAGRAAMQLNLELFDQNDVPQRASAVWEDLEEAARIAATEALARLIARMLQDQPPTEASDE